MIAAALGVVHTLWSHIPGELDDHCHAQERYTAPHTAVVGRKENAEAQIHPRDAPPGRLDRRPPAVQGRTSSTPASSADRLAPAPGLARGCVEGTDPLERFKAEAFQDHVYV
jgi:hypothetical protein